MTRSRGGHSGSSFVSSFEKSLTAGSLGCKDQPVLRLMPLSVAMLLFVIYAATTFSDFARPFTVPDEIHGA